MDLSSVSPRIFFHDASPLLIRDITVHFNKYYGPPLGLSINCGIVLASLFVTPDDSLDEKEASHLLDIGEELFYTMLHEIKYRGKK